MICQFCWNLKRRRKTKQIFSVVGYLIVPTPLEGGRTIYSTGFFFVQSILADRYIANFDKILKKFMKMLFILRFKTNNIVGYFP